MMSEWMTVHYEVCVADKKGLVSNKKVESALIRKNEGESMETFQERVTEILQKDVAHFSAILRIELFLSPHKALQMTLSEQTPTEKALSKEFSDYVQSLENLLIFMCQSHEDVWSVLSELAAQEKNRTILSVPKIQGLKNQMGITQLAKMEFSPPPFGFSEVVERMTARRQEKTSPSE